MYTRLNFSLISKDFVKNDFTLFNVILLSFPGGKKPDSFLEKLRHRKPITKLSNYIHAHMWTKHLRKQGVSIQLRVLSECLILIGSGMFDATFNLVTSVGLP